ncbi:MAG: hypothetical protein D4R64_18615 [Porphyromonadaceae bacterium]|nr:MAG: hypothetical protein D4R64_18615 [Porphyromonadaceae bacterium]
MQYILPTRLFLLASFIFFFMLTIQTNRESSKRVKRNESSFMIKLNPNDSKPHRFRSFQWSFGFV